jgi:hypothetical protein
MAATITQAPQVKKIAERLIPQHHKHLKDATIVYLFTDGARKKNGKIVLGTAKKTSPMEHFLSQRDTAEGANFILLFGIEEWRGLSEAQRIALVDHELMHCDVTYNEETGEQSWTIRAHDIEEFTDIVARHGLWQPDLEQFAAAFEQLRLPLEASA